MAGRKSEVSLFSRTVLLLDLTWVLHV